MVVWNANSDSVRIEKVNCDRITGDWLVATVSKILSKSTFIEYIANRIHVKHLE